MKKIITLLALAGMVCGAAAQDLYRVPRTLVVTAPTQLTGALTTNMVDLVGFTGIGKIDFCVTTNTGYTAVSGSLTITLEGSNDTNTWTTLAYGKMTSTSVSFTNLSIATNAVVTDTFMLPGVITTPTAYSAGFATPYLADNAASRMTNTAAITATSGTPVTVGVNLTDASRYLHVIYTATGGFTTNANVSAILTGFRAAGNP